MSDDEFSSSDEETVHDNLRRCSGSFSANAHPNTVTYENECSDMGIGGDLSCEELCSHEQSAIHPLPQVSTDTSYHKAIPDHENTVPQRVGVGDYSNNVFVKSNSQLEISSPLQGRKRRRASDDGTTHQASRRQRRSSANMSNESTSMCPCCSSSKQIISSLLWLLRNGSELTEANTDTACQSCDPQATSPIQESRRKQQHAKASPSKSLPHKRENKANSISKKQFTKTTLANQSQRPKLSASGRPLRHAQKPARFTDAI